VRRLRGDVLRFAFTVRFEAFLALILRADRLAVFLEIFERFATTFLREALLRLRLAMGISPPKRNAAGIQLEQVRRTCASIVNARWVGLIRINVGLLPRRSCVPF